MRSPCQTPLRVRSAIAVVVLLAVACGPTGPLPGDAVDAPVADATATAVPVVPSATGATAPPGPPSASPAPSGAQPASTGPAADPGGQAPAATPPSPPDGGDDGSPADPAAATAPPDGGTAPEALPPLPVDGPLGSLCRTYLRPAVPRLIVEIDAQAGAELPPAVIDHLTATVGAVVDKPGGITVDASGTIAGGAQPWTLESIREAAAASRTHAPTTDTTVIHVLAVRGEPHQTPPADGQPDIRGSIGIAFAAGELVVFPDRIDGLSALVGGTTAVLRAVTVHEVGHLLCLVNLGYTSDIPHEDPSHPGHSVDQGSVMFHAVETTAVGQIFTGPPPDTFTTNDLADLEGLRTGRY